MQKPKAKPFDSDYKVQPGMDEKQMHEDMTAWRVSFEETIAKFMNLGDMGGPQVGNNYDGDAMGEERMHMTFPGNGKDKAHKTE